MKKKTIATSLLAILVSTYAAPFVSNAEAIKGATKETTEQVTPAEEEPAAPAEEEPAAPVVDEAPVVENEEPAAPVADEAPAAEKEEVKAPTTKIAPATEEAPETRDLASELAAYKETVYAEIEAGFAAGYLTREEYYNFNLRVERAANHNRVSIIQTEVATTIENAKKAKDDAAVTDAFDAAKTEVAGLKDAKKITLKQANASYAIIDQAKADYTAGRITAEEAQAKIAEGLALAQSNAYATDLANAKEAAKNELPGLVADGKLPSADYYDTLQKIDAATTIEDVEAIINAITNGTTVTPPTNNDLANAQTVAKDALAQWLAEGLLTETEYNNFVSEVEQSTTVDAVNAVLANAQDLVDSRRPVENTTLAEAKQNAKDKLFTWLSYGQINDNQYVNALNAVNSATTVAEVEAIIAGVQADINNEVAATLAQIKQDAKDQLFEWFTNGDLTAEDYAFYLSEVIAATDAEGVAATIASAEQQIQQNGLHFDLEAYKQDARDQLATWLANGFITGDQYWAYLSLIDVATTPEQVDAALEALLAEIENSEKPEDVTNKPVGTPTNQNNNTNNVLVTLTTTTEGGKKAIVTTKDVVKNADSSKATLPKTGEVNQNLTSLGLVSVALGSLVAVLKRKRS